MMQTVRAKMESLELLSLTVAVTLASPSVSLCFEHILDIDAFCAELPDILQDLVCGTVVFGPNLLTLLIRLVTEGYEDFPEQYSYLY
jgi:hypothetical protein